MNTKRLLVILIAVAFALVLIFSCITVFSVKKVDVEFSVASDTDVCAVEQTLDKYLGKNLLFLKVSEVEDALKEHYQLKVLHVEKQYPNVLSVKLEERRETYYLEHGDNVYTLSEEGFVLNTTDKNQFNAGDDREKITLKIKTVNMNIEDATLTESDADLVGTTIGSTISLQGDEFLSTVFSLAKKVNLTDCIKELKVEKIVNGTVVVCRDVVITTYTGVKIRVMNADERGEDKIGKAFTKYDSAPTDYIKTFDYIIASVSEGTVTAEWSTVDFSPFDLID